MGFWTRVRLPSSPLNESEANTKAISGVQSEMPGACIDADPWHFYEKLNTKNGSNGARTRDLSRVRRTLIPAELCFHGCHYSTDQIDFQ